MQISIIKISCIVSNWLNRVTHGFIISLQSVSRVIDKKYDRP